VGVNNAFLHEDMDKEVCMQLPLGLNFKKKNQVYHLHKSLYGLKQANHQWFAKLSSFLISHNFKQAFTNHSLFLKLTNHITTVLLVYVDDIILTTNDIDEITNIASLLDQIFIITNLGDLTYFLGIDVVRSSKGIHLSK